MSFRLASVLRVRHLQEDVAAAAAGGAAVRAGNAREDAAQRRDELAARSFAAHGDEWTFAATVAARSASAARFTESLAARSAAEDDAAAAAAVWAEARRDARALDRLGERHDAEQGAAELRAEQAVLDEHAGRSHSARTPTGTADATADLTTDLTDPTGALR